MNRRILSGVAVLVLAVPGPILAGKGAAVVKPQSELTWKNMGVPGVSSAVVDGDMAKGPSRFYLKYASGLKTPLHHHTADHHVTTISGSLVISAAGKETPLTPGSYFAFTGGIPHVARCEGKDDCVMFIEADGAWDVVPEKP